MSDYIKRKEYKLPDGSTVTAYFDELGCAKITIQAMDALFDILNSSVEVVRCKDCKYQHECYSAIIRNLKSGGEIHCPLDFCSVGERATHE